jgi:hypothetical protein
VRQNSQNPCSFRGDCLKQADQAIAKRADPLPDINHSVFERSGYRFA